MVGPGYADGWLVGRSVSGQSVVSNFPSYSRAQIHSLGRRAFQAVGNIKCVCEHTSLTHLTTSTEYTCGLSIGINVLPGVWHIISACGLSTSAANGQDFTVSHPPNKRITKQKYSTNCWALPAFSVWLSGTLCQIGSTAQQQQFYKTPLDKVVWELRRTLSTGRYAPRVCAV